MTGLAGQALHRQYIAPTDVGAIFGLKREKWNGAKIVGESYRKIRE